MKSHYLDLLKSVEMFKEETMRRLYEEKLEDMNEAGPGSNPLAKATPLMVNGYPVFQFSYDGMLPLYKEDDRDYAAMVRNYYQRITFESYNYTDVNNRFGRAVIIIQHYFNDNVIRDLDNRNRKYIIDAIRHTGLVKDDNWKELSIIEEGLVDKQNHIQVYLLADENKINFLRYLEKHQHHLKQIPDVGQRSEIENELRQHSRPKDKSAFANQKQSFHELWGE
ncbi:hypothetical protein [Lentibacillus amyloliquefaciens]|uniref:Uncharacterized protein n=1 Tax=Lentibacillus amyloliquefaciens TaxID=1472767 RepID=A0A0U3W3E2_9BACI|nr:hypothetical protein [Lentibacillus amyloliquefaciens]ALX47714.1 hypothetical protein AOX59_03300 [Lentibacillus amyloliquefaciens]